MSPPILQDTRNCQASAQVNIMVHITSNHINFVGAVDYRGGVTAGDFGLCISEIAHKCCFILLELGMLKWCKRDDLIRHRFSSSREIC